MKICFLNIITHFSCLIWGHKWKWSLVMTKKKIEHCKGIEEINHDKEAHLQDGRSCKNCKNEQYFYYHITVCGWQNVLN